MKVRELIEILSKMDGELQVRAEFYTGDDTGYIPKVVHRKQEWAAIVFPSSRLPRPGAEAVKTETLQSAKKEPDDAGNAGRK